MFCYPSSQQMPVRKDLSLLSLEVAGYLSRMKAHIPGGCVNCQLDS